MGRHLGIGSVDVGIVEAGLDDRRLRVVRNEELGGAANPREGADMASIQSGSACVQLAQANVKLDAPRTATKT